jgi:hypothetical protein
MQLSDSRIPPLLAVKASARALQFLYAQEVKTMRIQLSVAAMSLSMILGTGCIAAQNDEAAATDQDEEALATVALGVDTNGSTLDIGHAKSQGVGFVGRYISFDGSHPVLSASEVARFKGQMPLIAIWEKDKRRAVESGSVQEEFLRGVEDAHASDKALSAAGVPGKAVYFTVDFDVTPSFWNEKTKDTATKQEIVKGDLVIAYFKGIKSVLGVKRMGAYGTYTTVKELFDAGLIHYGWQQTFASRGDKTDARAQLRQYDIYPDQTGWGVSGAGALDLDRAVKGSFGQF